MLSVSLNKTFLSRNQRSRCHGKGIILYMSKTVSRGIYLTHVYKAYVWNRGGQNISIGSDHHESSWPLGNGDPWKQHIVDCCSAVRSWGSVWGGGFLRCTYWSCASHRWSVGFKTGRPRQYLDVVALHKLLITTCNMVWHCHAETFPCGHSVQNDVILQNVISISHVHQCTCQSTRKEVFYLMMHSTHFIYGYMVSDIW